MNVGKFMLESMTIISAFIVAATVDSWSIVFGDFGALFCGLVFGWLVSTYARIRSTE
jgi:ABC-type uncharacterized transport system permease subunit